MFRLIIILILVYLLYRVLVRYIIPYALKNYLSKQQEKFYRQNPDAREKMNRKEGEVHITRKPGGEKKRASDEVGDYVDYEEIDE